MPRAPYAAVACALLGIVAFSVRGAIAVARGRADVERNVVALVALQRAIEEPARAGAALEPLRAHASREVAAEAEKAIGALAEKPAVTAMGPVVGALRRDNARLSETLGGHIDGLYFSVAVLVVLAAATLWLLWRLRAAAQVMQQVADQKIASAQEEHHHRLATVQGLAASTAHEVNNPLTAMVLNLEILKMSDGLTEPMRQAIEANFDGAARIARIVSELRQIAAPVPGSGVELGAVIDATLRLLEHRVRPRAHVIQEVAERGSVRAEYVGLGQVVSNLVVNALEAFGDRPAAENRITVATRTLDSERVELSVSDNGPGFDRAAFGRLMTPFVTTKATGSGLGLFVCKRIIERFEGTLTLVPLDHGAQVRVVLRKKAA